MSIDSGESSLAGLGWDRNATARETPHLLEALRAAPSTRVLVMHDGQTLIADGNRIAYRAPSAVGAEADVAWGYLGTVGGIEYLVCAVTDAAQVEQGSAQWRHLREVGGELTSEEAEALVEATALSRWYAEAKYCPFCGATTTLEQAGWMRVCNECAREHFPRTDPAVIVLITDGDRALLGSNAMWRGNRFSCFAGFVEAGESVEDAIRREVKEEAGVDVTDITYRGSQAWPYPRSLMLGFVASVADTAAAEADGEEILEVRWFTKSEVREALSDGGDVQLPGKASIAHELISQWAAG